MRAAALGILLAFGFLGSALAEDPRRFLGVKKWTGKVTMRASYKRTQGPLTLEVRSTLDGKLGFDTIVEEDADFRVWGMGYAGTASIYFDTLSEAGGAYVRATYQGSGAIGADSEARLSIDLDKGIYELHLFSAQFPGELKTDSNAGGQRVQKTEKAGVSIGSWTGTGPLPATGLALGGKLRCSLSQCKATGITHDPNEPIVDLEWELRPEGKPLTAIPGGPYRTSRAGQVTLDGSRSKGDILRYRWKVTPLPCSADGPAAPATEHEGARWTFTALCGARASLTVADASGEDSADAEIEVTPRDFKLRVTHVGREARFDGGAPVVTLNYDGGIARGSGFVGAENRCKHDPEPPHTFHPPPADGSWLDRGWEAAQVAGGGPWDKWWYVKRSTLEITRETAMNQHLLPGTTFHRDNSRPGGNIAAYLAAVRAHEREHTTRMASAVSADDPAKRIEALVDSADRAALARKVDASLVAAERVVCQATKDPLPVTFDGSLWLRVAPSNKLIQGMTTVGGEATMTMVCP